MTDAGNCTGRSSDQAVVRCEEIRTGLSARLDDEDPGVPEEVLDRHLQGCAACTAWVDGAATASRRLRVRLPDAPRDLTAAVLGRLSDPAAHGRSSRPVARLALVATALLQLVLSLPALLYGEEEQAGLHVAREVGATDVALAIGVLAAAWRPWRAAGMLPVVGALAVGLSATTLVDVLGGQVPAAHELPHLLALVETVLLWRLRRIAGPVPSATSPEPQRLRRVA